MGEDTHFISTVGICCTFLQFDVTSVRNIVIINLLLDGGSGNDWRNVEVTVASTAKA
jgi:hypothetical protein